MVVNEKHENSNFGEARDMLVIHVINHEIWVRRGDQQEMKRIPWMDLRELLARYVM